MRVIVDFELCQSHALCTEAAPEIFEITADGLLNVKIEEPDEKLRSKLLKAIGVCPTRAIRMKER
jgi:ferredoxin